MTTLISREKMSKKFLVKNSWQWWGFDKKTFRIVWKYWFLTQNANFDHFRLKIFCQFGFKKFKFDFLRTVKIFFLSILIFDLIVEKKSISWVSCFFQGPRRRKTSFTYLDMASGLGSTHSGPRVAKKFKNQWQKFNNPFV